MWDQNILPRAKCWLLDEVLKVEKAEVCGSLRETVQIDCLTSGHGV